MSDFVKIRIQAGPVHLTVIHLQTRYRYQEREDPNIIYFTNDGGVFEDVTSSVVEDGYATVEVETDEAGGFEAAVSIPRTKGPECHVVFYVRDAGEQDYRIASCVVYPCP